MPLLHNGRLARLEIAFTELMTVARSSDLIDVLPMNAKNGWPAEKYVVTYRCRGIARVDAARVPEYSDHHEMHLTLTTSYPESEPLLVWQTDIWHPNINALTRKVCTNAPETYYAGKSLTELVVKIGEMVQYKHYFAKMEFPWPDNTDAATWVREVAEPEDLLPVDTTQLIRGLEISFPQPRRVVLGPSQGVRIGHLAASAGSDETKLFPPTKA